MKKLIVFDLDGTFCQKQSTSQFRDATPLKIKSANGCPHPMERKRLSKCRLGMPVLKSNVKKYGSLFRCLDGHMLEDFQRLVSHL